MQNIILMVHLLLALSLIGIVLLQRSEGGGLTGGGGDMMSRRSAASALSKLTWGLAIAFVCTSLSLTIVAGYNSSNNSVLDQIAPQGEGDAPLDGNDLLPPSADTSEPLLPTVE